MKRKSELSSKKINTFVLQPNTIFRGHFNGVSSFAISQDEKLIVSGSSDGTLRIWEVVSGNLLKTLENPYNLGTIKNFHEIEEEDGEDENEEDEDEDDEDEDDEDEDEDEDEEYNQEYFTYTCITFTSKNDLVFAGDTKGNLNVWDLKTSKLKSLLKGLKSSISAIAVSLDGKIAVLGDDRGRLSVWDLKNETRLFILRGHKNFITSIKILPDGNQIFSSSYDGTIRLWDINTKGYKTVLEMRNQYSLDDFPHVTITSDNKKAVVSAEDNSLLVWDFDLSYPSFVLEGHQGSIYSIAVTSDNQYIVSSDVSGELRIWDLNTGYCLCNFHAHSSPISAVCFLDGGKQIISSSLDGLLCKWHLIESEPILVKEVLSKYTNAKVLLVGDSGVGKSGLAHRLTTGKYIQTDSTDGVWATQMSLPNVAHTVDTEREIWLWDFAGQSDYRLIHQLFMDETSLAVLVFNPQADNPFEGLGQWDRDLQKAARRPFKKLLVAGRCDRGSLTVSRKTLDDFKDEREFAKYLETSALTGVGCDELREEIIKHINWDDIPYRSSPRIFKLLKEEILKLKDEGRVLLTLSELKQNLELRLADEKFTFDESKTVVGLLAGSGVVWQLEFGDFVLLQPERVNSYAATVVRAVRAHVDEIGCIAEERVLNGELDYQDMVRLPKKEEEIVLRAMHQTFIERGLCLRELTDAGYLLVFPSYFRRERPPLDKHPSALVTYQFSGMLDEIYATLVVKLHHTSAFDKEQLWRYAADFKTQGGKRVGLKMTKKPEGAAEITIYFEKDIPDDTKAVFIRYVHDHLKAKDENVVRVRHYVCPHCGEPFENERAIQIRLGKNLKDITCPVCDEKFNLWDLIEEKFASDEFQQRVRRMEEESKIALDNESRELILVGHAYAIAGQAGQIFRQTSNSDWGIDGEIEFKDYEGKASGKRVYLQLKSGNSYLRTRKRDEKEIFDIKPRHAEYWQNHNYDVMLVIRTTDDEIRWMNATEYLKKHGKNTRQIIFDGEPFTALNVLGMRDKLLSGNK